MEKLAKKYEGLLYSTPLKSTSPFPSSQDCFDSCQTVFPISLIIEVEISAKKNKNGWISCTNISLLFKKSIV